MTQLRKTNGQPMRSFRPDGKVGQFPKIADTIDRSLWTKKIWSKRNNFEKQKLLLQFFSADRRLAWISSKLFIEKNSFRCHMVAMFKFQANAFQWKDNPRRLSPQRIVKILITSFESCQICQNFINLGLINIYLDWNYLVFWRVRRRLAKCSVLMN